MVGRGATSRCDTFAAMAGPRWCSVVGVATVMLLAKRRLRHGRAGGWRCDSGSSQPQRWNLTWVAGSPSIDHRAKEH